MTRGRTMAATLGVVVALVAMGVGPGCSRDKDSAGGSNGTATSVAGEDHRGEDDDAEGDGHGHAAPTLLDPATGKQGRIRESDKYTAASPPPAVFRQPDILGADGSVPLEASTSPPCVEHGQKLTATLRSEPGMTVVAQIKWPNDQFSGLDNTRGQTGADGLYVWVVEVKPTALWGVADLQAAAIDERPGQGTRSGTQGNWKFVVAPPGRC